MGELEEMKYYAKEAANETEGKSIQNRGQTCYAV